MTTRRSFFASLAALVVAPKVLKTIPTGTENYVRNVLDIPWVSEHQTRMWAAIEAGRKVTFFPIHRKTYPNLIDTRLRALDHLQNAPNEWKPVAPGISVGVPKQ